MIRRAATAALLRTLIEVSEKPGSLPDSAQVESLCSAIGELVALDGELEVEAAVDALLINGRRVRLNSDPSGGLSGLAERFRGAGLSGFRTGKLQPTEDFSALFLVLAGRAPSIATSPFTPVAGSLELIEHQPVAEEITTNRRMDLERMLGADDASSHFDDFRQISETYARAVVYLARLLDTMERSGPTLPLAEAEHLACRLVDHWMDAPEAFLTISLAAPPEADYEPYHMVNTAVLSIAIGATVGFDRSGLFDICLAALLHRVGRVDMPASLDSDRVLGADERKVIALLPLCSARRVLQAQAPNIHGLARLVAIAEINRLSCRQDEDGTLRSIQPPLTLMTRILAAASHFDALTAKRSFRPAMPAKQALETMATTLGLRFDPLLLRVLARLQGVKIGTGDGGDAS
jgi:HD-GYP domain-containing protein (c-di-GMP phosphodiesterase class II)